MLITFITGLILLMSLALCAYAAWSDYRSLTIPNFIPVCLCLLFIGAVLIQEIFLDKTFFYASLSSHLLAVLIVFTVTALMFSLNVFGAGDAKLLTALTLWTGFYGLSAMVFWMAVIGGVLAFAAIMIKKYKPFSVIREDSWPDRLQKGHNAVPYGVAIFGGFLFAFAHMGYFQTALWWS